STQIVACRRSMLWNVATPDRQAMGGLVVDILDRGDHVTGILAAIKDNGRALSRPRMVLIDEAGWHS
ncbi:MAG: hypothetical protein ACK58L_08665, partial [Planctomycetota bacterium]